MLEQNLVEDVKMTQIDKMIIDFIVDYYKENLFYPSYDEIAEEIGRAKATVYTHMKKLEDEGVIIRKADCSPQYRLINMRLLLRAKGGGYADPCGL